MKNIKKQLYLSGLQKLDKILKPRSCNEITFMMTFSDDIIPVLEAVIQTDKFIINLLYHPKYESVIEGYQINKISLSMKESVKQLKAIKSSKVIVIDTYYLMLGAIDTSHATVIQTWHAAGALKQFGLEYRSIQNADSKMIEDYKKVYHATDYYLVASHTMADIFNHSLDASESQFLYYGLPRLDKYFPISSENKRLIAYVPTYRDYQDNDYHFDKNILAAEFPDYDIVVKLHPALGQSDHISIEKIIKESEYVITDYSSLAIEAALNNKKVIFYSYDEKKYAHLRGLNKFYYKMSQKNKAYDFETLIHTIKNYEENSIINEFWNTYNDGHATERVVQFIQKEVER